MSEVEAAGVPATSAEKLRVLIVDDDSLVRESVQACLEPFGHETTPCTSADHALVAIDRLSFDMALVDLRLSDTSGLDLIPQLLERDPALKIVVMTGYGSLESAVEAMRRGAFEYVTKPLSPSELNVLTERVGERIRLERRIEALEEDADRFSPTALLESDNPGMKRSLALALKVAPSDATVLLEGESGTGKGVLAKAIHGWSPRSEHPMAVVNCPSLSAELLRSELFGHLKGSFTGAVDNKIGKITFADGGTLFMDEVGELPEEIQPRLLRFLQDREYERVGDPETRRADVRVIAATNRDLERAVQDGRFREDLFYRLNVIAIELPPLRSRREDIPRLAQSFLFFFANKYGKTLEGFTDSALDFLTAQPWPGNVRELQNAIERAVILAGTSQVGVSLFPKGATGSLGDGVALGSPDELPTLEGMEERYIRHVLQVTDSIERAAEILDVAPSTLWRRRRKYGI